MITNALKKAALLFVFAGCLLSSEGVFAQDDSAETERPLSPEDTQKRAQADRALEQANTLFQAGNLRDALPLFAESLRLNREVLGSEHPYAMTGLNNYAVALDTAGRTAEAEPLYAEVLRLRRDVLGMKHPKTLASLHNHALVLRKLDRFAAAEPLYVEVLPLRQKMLGADHPDTLDSLFGYTSVLRSLGHLKRMQSVWTKAEALLSREGKLTWSRYLSEEALRLYQAKKPRAAEPLFARALWLRQEVLGTKHPDTLKSLTSYALMLSELDRPAEAEPLFINLLNQQREILGTEHPDTLASMNVYAVMLNRWNRPAEAEALYADTLRLRRTVLGAKHPDTMISMNNHAAVLDKLGRLDEAEPLYSEALRLRREQLGAKHDLTKVSIDRHADILHRLGRLTEAQPLYGEALQLQRETLGSKHPDTLTSLSNYAVMLGKLDRGSEAETLSAEALRLRREVLGAKHPDFLDSLNSYALVITGLGRTAEAESIYAETLKLRREVLGENHVDTLGSLNNHATVLLELGRFAEAEPLFAEAFRSAREVLGAEHPNTLLSMSNYAVILGKLNNEAEAEPILAETLRLRRKVLGAKHPDTLISINNYATMLHSLGREGEAETLFSEALSLQIEAQGEKHASTHVMKVNLVAARINVPSRSYLAIDHARSIAMGVRDGRAILGFTAKDEVKLGRSEERQTGFFRLFAEAAWARGPGLAEEALAAGARPLSADENSELREEAFAALQDALAGAAGKAISATVARKAAGSLEPLALKREALTQQWAKTDQEIVKSLGKSGNMASETRITLRTQLAETEARLKDIDERLRDEAPDYFSLIRPGTLSLSQAQKVLASDEVAIAIVPTIFGTHIMLVSDEGLRWAHSEWTRTEVDAAVKRLLWDVGADVDVNAVEALEWGDEGSGAYPFSFDSAYALYRELITPIADGLKGKRHVFVSASGSLSSLPFGMLVSVVPTGKAGDPEVLRSAKWFADDYALIQIPTLQSLEFLRKYRSSDGTSAKSPFLGIGDPVLIGKSQMRGSRRSNKLGEKSDGAFKRLFRDTQTRDAVGMADISELRQMARLPGTATELTAMWEEFGSPDNALFLADQATEDFVRTKSLDADVIAFATHGLLAGDINGAAEPGLVLTPPSEASESNDGYLSASEIAALKINADWVILSACNTAAGDGSEGAPGLSGLARSFFYAGARNLLASHWPVRDDVAAKLTVRTISIAKDNPKLSRAEAFQQAMREIRNNKSADSENDTWAHPNAWAPFSLIGDGAR